MKKKFEVLIGVFENDSCERSQMFRIKNRKTWDKIIEWAEKGVKNNE